MSVKRFLRTNLESGQLHTNDWMETLGFQRGGLLTFNVRHYEHLWLGQALLEVVEMDGAVEGNEAYFCPRVSWKPETHRHLNGNV